MDPTPNPKPLMAAGNISVLVGSIVLAKPWLVERLGIKELSINGGLIQMLAEPVVCAMCIALVKILNRPGHPMMQIDHRAATVIG